MSKEQTVIDTPIADCLEMQSTDVVKLDDFSLALIGGGEMVVAL